MPYMSAPWILEWMEKKKYILKIPFTTGVKVTRSIFCTDHLINDTITACGLLANIS